MAITFSTIEIDTLKRGIGPEIAQEFIEAVQAQLTLPAYAQSGFSISIDEFKHALGYTGNGKTSSVVWAVNTHLESRKLMLRCGVRRGGTRVAFWNWDGKKRHKKAQAD